MRSFTLVELITVLVIVGIGTGLFYSVLFVNWSSYEKQLSLIDLQMEADLIMEMISTDVKAAQLFTVSGDNKSVVLFFPAGGSTVTYSLMNNGRMQKTSLGNTNILSENIDYINSSFNRAGDALEVNLTFNERIFGRRVELGTSTQIVPRNL